MFYFPIRTNNHYDSIYIIKFTNRNMLFISFQIADRKRTRYSRAFSASSCCFFFLSFGLFTSMCFYCQYITVSILSSINSISCSLNNISFSHFLLYLNIFFLPNFTCFYVKNKLSLFHSFLYKIVSSHKHTYCTRDLFNLSYSLFEGTGT